MPVRESQETVLLHLAEKSLLPKANSIPASASTRSVEQEGPQAVDQQPELARFAHHRTSGRPLESSWRRCRRFRRP